MKGRKLLCLDVKILEKLEGLNASLLVNDFLKEHFGSTRENIEKRKAEVASELNEIAEEEAEIEIIENETAAQALLREKKEALFAKRLAEFKSEKDKLTVRVKAKEITFDEYKEACDKLREVYGIR